MSGKRERVSRNIQASDVDTDIDTQPIIFYAKSPCQTKSPDYISICAERPKIMLNTRVKQGKRKFQGGVCEYCKRRMIAKKWRFTKRLHFIRKDQFPTETHQAPATALIIPIHCQIDQNTSIPMHRDA
jgi:hypothetical protein